MPGYTANLPAGLIADMAGTGTGAVALIDQLRVDLINSCSPYGANIPLLKQLGSIYGVPQGMGTNTSVYVVFTAPPGFPIPKGFTVGDGNNQYAVVRDAVTPTGGQTEPLYCLATSAGSWAVPEGSVTQIITSVPKSYVVTCTNLTAGLPGLDDQTYSSYRAQVMQSGMKAVQGVPDYFRTLMQEVEGVQENLISYRQFSQGKWVAVVGGGDPYEVAYAIYKAIPDISMLTNDVSNPSGNPVDKKTVQIDVYPDSYQIPYVVPTSQTASVYITWNTASTNYVDPTGVSNAVQQPVVDYIEAIAVGQPINALQIKEIFLDAVQGLIPKSLVSMIDVQVGINGTIVPPEASTELVYGDTYGYFATTLGQIQVEKYGSTS
ncbi:baseplate J/gp47 family protein [Pantoea stewartii]|nr:baseplate J/gp47 family protein [Pantoea stewartii]